MIKKVLLLNPPMNPEIAYGNTSEFGSVSPPTGLCYIASNLRENGYEVSILDAEAEKLSIGETLDEIMSYNPDVVGMACKTLWVSNAYKVAEKLKKKSPNTIIIAGGNHVTALPEQSLNEFSCFDFIIIGEGEITFLALLNALNINVDLELVYGIAYKKNGKNIITKPRERIKDLDQLPFPAYDLLPELKTYYWPVFNNVDNFPTFSIINSRGCSGRCMFCDRGMFGNEITHHSPSYVVSLIKELKSKYGIKYLVFDDDNFLLNKKYLFEVLDLMIKEKVKMPFTCESRADTIDDEMLSKLRKAGCKRIMFGIESGSQDMLNKMNKKITLEQIRKAVKLTKKYGVKTLGYFIVGFPGETKETLDITVHFIKELDLFDISVSIFTPLPGSEIYKNVKLFGEYGEKWDRPDSLKEVAFLPQSLTIEDLENYVKKYYEACYNKWWQYFYIIKRIKTLKHLKLIFRAYTKGIY